MTRQFFRGKGRSGAEVGTMSWDRGSTSARIDDETAMGCDMADRNEAAVGSAALATRVLDQIGASWMSQAICTAAELRIPELIAGGSHTMDELARGRRTVIVSRCIGCCAGLRPWGSASKPRTARLLSRRGGRCCARTIHRACAAVRSGGVDICGPSGGACRERQVGRKRARTPRGPEGLRAH